MHIVFWQRMLSPHMMGLAEALARRGSKVTFIAAEELSQARRNQGWQVTPQGAVERRIIADPAGTATFIASLGRSTIHITQGLRGSAEMRRIQNQIVAAGQQLWIIMETVDPAGWRAPLKKLVYRWEIFRRRKHIKGVLAIGAGTAEWLTARGLPARKAFPFAYFVSLPAVRDAAPDHPSTRPYTFGYVGNLEPWKNPALAIDAYGLIANGGNRLMMVGDGSLRDTLVQRARTGLPHAQIEFTGRLPMAEVPQVLAQIDCLVLPSNVDGWGVVASEAMLVGTPVIASTACGVRAAVQAAPAGAVFDAGDPLALKAAMMQMQAAGRDPDRRYALKTWALTLAAEFGADYLEQILTGSVRMPLPEWLQRKGPLA